MPVIRKALARAFLFVSIFVFELRGDGFSSSNLFDLESIRDASTLETDVLVDWRPLPQEPRLKQKFVEITVCEWWPGQRVRIPVTLVAPREGGPCENLLLINMSLALKPATPNGEPLRLAKEKGVGIVMVGMGVIEGMKPVNELHHGMREQLLKTKDLRYTTAWIWGMSQMRGLTAALAETDVFQPSKVLATGGSKRGIGSAVAGIHDDRFTAILPIVAPPLGDPGGAYVLKADKRRAEAFNELSLDRLAKKGFEFTDEMRAALDDRAVRRANTRIMKSQAEAAGWSRSEIEDVNHRVWDASRIVNFLSQLDARGLQYFYNVGTNDGVTPALLELGRNHPEFPICIIPGGQHGGPSEAGYTRRVTVQEETLSNLEAFARTHFFGDRKPMPGPRIRSVWNVAEKRLEVSVRFENGLEPESNTLWWTVDKSPMHTYAAEYDSWESKAMRRVGKGVYEANIAFEKQPGKLDFLSLHRHTENELTWSRSSPYQRIER